LHINKRARIGIINYRSAFFIYWDDLLNTSADISEAHNLVWLFCHFLLAQKVTKKGTTNANRLIGLVAQGYTPGPTNLTVRTVRGQATRRLIGF